MFRYSIHALDRRAVACATLVGLAATGARAEPYRISGYIEATNYPGAFGEPIRVLTGPIFQHPFSGTFPPTSTAISLFPDLAFDSYVTIDGAGFSTDTYTARTPNQAINNHNFWPDPQTLDLIGIFSADYPMSGVREFDGALYDAVAFARITSTDPEDSIIADSVFVTLRERDGAPDEQNIRLELGVGVFTTEGFLISPMIPGESYQPYTLIVDEYQMTIDGQPMRVFDLYVAAPVPAPGAALILAALSGGALANRRRAR